MTRSNLGAALAAAMTALLVAGCTGTSVRTDTDTAQDQASAQAAPTVQRPSPSEVLAAATPEDWRTPASEWTVVMDLPSGRVVIELGHEFAPRTAENIRRLVRGGYFDGLAVIRVHDDYVVQWGDPAEEEADAKPKPADVGPVPAEFDRPLEGLTLLEMTDVDPWSPRVGFVGSFPVATDPAEGRAWIAHCYGTLGVGRGATVDSGDGSSLYAVIGQPARYLDRNITTAGRVLSGMELLAGLPRGTGQLGFYAEAGQRTPIVQVRMADDMPEAERPRLQVLVPGPRMAAWLDARRHRSGWFVHDHGRIDLCAAQPPVRTAP